MITIISHKGVEMPRHFLITVMSAIFVVAGPVPAFAHAHLESSSPSADATVATAPEEVALDFSEDIEPKFSRIEIEDAKGMRVDKGDAHLASGNPKHFVVSVKPLQPGLYKVIWSVTSTDTHKTHGSYTFKLQK
jgi:methionine-rich copper-binding protein CopC